VRLGDWSPLRSLRRVASHVRPQAQSSVAVSSCANCPLPTAHCIHPLYICGLAAGRRVQKTCRHPLHEQARADERTATPGRAAIAPALTVATFTFIRAAPRPRSPSFSHSARTRALQLFYLCPLMRQLGRPLPSVSSLHATGRSCQHLPAWIEPATTALTCRILARTSAFCSIFAPNHHQTGDQAKDPRPTQ
jgi:hypothetical protein